MHSANAACPERRRRKTERDRPSCLSPSVLSAAWHGLSSGRWILHSRFEFGLPTDGWSEILQRNIVLSCRIYVLCSPHKCTYFFDLLGPLVYFVSCDMSRSAERCCMGTSLQSTTRVSSAASHKPPPPLTTCRQWAHPRPALRPLRTPL